MLRSMMTITAAFAVLFLMAAELRPPAVAQEESIKYCATEAELEMLQLINQLREEHGLDRLELSQPLGVAAEPKARDMAEQDYLSHVSPDGQTPRELLDEVGYPSNTAIGENIAAGQQSAEATFEQWLNSQTHREIMLSEEFAAIGIGRAHNPDAQYEWYWAAEFGSVVGEPAEACQSATPAATPAMRPGPGEGVEQVQELLRFGKKEPAGEAVK